MRRSPILPSARTVVSQVERLDAVLRDGARGHRALDEGRLLQVALEGLER